MAEEQLDTVMYSQFQPWTSVGASPCMEQTAGPGVPIRVGTYYNTPKRHPWRPTLGYENVEITPLTAEPVTYDLIDPCFTAHKEASQPLKYPNMVTGFERNPAHAARTALYTRYTAREWTEFNISAYKEAEIMRRYAERFRCGADKAMVDEHTAKGQRETGRRLGERITDLTFWRNEAHAELEKLLTEVSKLRETKHSIEKAIIDLDGPLHIAQECLYQREKRQGIDLVHDSVEVSLLRELDSLKNAQKKLKNFLETFEEQFKSTRAAQHELETDVKSKEGALGCDNLCHQLSNFSRGINYYGGIERYDPCVSNAETWSENSNRRVQMSQAERSKSAQMRKDADNLINGLAKEIWDAWSNTNNTIARRAAETLEAKSKLQEHLHKLQHEIFDVENTIERLKKSILEYQNPLKVAHTRLEARSHRLNIELCRDYAQDSLIREVQNILSSVHKMHKKLEHAEALHQTLLMTRAKLESDLQNKVNTLFIDRERCMDLRKSFPITATIKY